DAKVDTIYDDESGSGLTTKLGRVAQVDYFPSVSATKIESVAYTYDALGRRDLITETKWNGTNLIETRLTDTDTDSEGRTVKVASPEGVIEYAYDAITGRQTKMWTANTEVRYDHDNLGRLVNVAEWKRGGVVLNTPVETKYAYNDIGNVTSVMVTDGANTPRFTTHSYDPQRHWLTGIENKSAGVLVSSFAYTRRADGQMSKVVESVTQPGGGLENTTAIFTYDASNRLTKETVTTGTGVGNYTKEYILDLVGNRVELVETKGWQDPVSTLSTYNARDQLLTEATGSTTITHGYNANGSLTTKHVNGVLQSEQAWDVRGRLEGLKDASGNWTAQYRYTPEGIRSAVTEGTTTTLYVIDILGPSGYAQVIEERTAAGLVVGSYVYGPSLDPLSQWRSGGQGANLYLADGHSGVRQAVNLTGTVLLAQRFDAFGGTMATAGTLSNVIGYRGERFDNTLGQYYLRARYYNPATGRFTGMDPFHGNYGDPAQIMRYGYAGMNPIWSVDPSGLFTQQQGYLAEDAIQTIYERDHFGDDINWGRWTKLGTYKVDAAYRLKPDIQNRTTKKWLEIKPFSPSGIAGAAVAFSTYSVALGIFNYSPDSSWKPSTHHTNAGIMPIFFWNAGGIVFYTDIIDASEDLVGLATITLARRYMSKNASRFTMRTAMNTIARIGAAGVGVRNSSEGSRSGLAWSTAFLVGVMGGL
ncbi:MAG: RHS repeat-associated core domain-containing protein, partial [Gemmataceae bacterium]